MKLEQQVCTLESAKRLKELGVKQNSIFNYKTYWIDKHNPKVPEIQYNPSGIEPIRGDTFTNLQFVSAFTVAELGQMLWDVFEKIGWEYIYKVYGDVFNFKGTSWIGELGIVNLMRDPDMSAKMLIYLLEQGLIK